MRVVVDALPINNFSGRRVLLGHLRNLAAAGKGRHSFHVLHHAGNRDLRRDFGENIEWVECERVGSGWMGRLLWQRRTMQKQLDAMRADVVISTSGAMVPGVTTPQIVLAQNPWCFFPAFHAGAMDKLKAGLQRHGYRVAQRKAAAVFYLSDYMAEAYRTNAGQPPRHGTTILVGVENGMFMREQRDPAPPFDQRGLEIATVSAMTPHKSVEDVVDALAVLRSRGIGARLSLVGPWSDAAYRASIERRIADKALSTAVSIEGAVSDDGLIESYRRARAFCLLSRCESFGIPSVEAQVFGTPCVVADVCAPPEICGPGGRIVPAGDIVAAADALQVLLTDRAAWSRASEQARANAERFRWTRLSGPMIEFLDAWEKSS